MGQLQALDYDCFAAVSWCIRELLAGSRSGGVLTEEVCRLLVCSTSQNLGRSHSDHARPDSREPLLRLLRLLCGAAVETHWHIRK